MCVSLWSDANSGRIKSGKTREVAYNNKAAGATPVGREGKELKEGGA